MSAASFAALSDVGCVRAQNEDRWFADPDQHIYIVSDGVGGLAAGEVASRVVVEILPGRLRKVLAKCDDLRQPFVLDRIVATISSLSRDIRVESENQTGLSGMGATMVLAVIRDERALIVHLGDSRAYLLRSHKLQLLTRDHTVAQALVNAGEVSEADALSHPGASQLARFVGMEGNAQPDARVIDIRDAERILLCSDGLSGLVSHGDIQKVLCDVRAPAEACKQLIGMAKQHGGEDNITALIVDAEYA